jgi:hypothetical protein
MQTLINWVFDQLQKWSHTNNIEYFILSRNPKDIADIERLTLEYNSQISKGSSL